MSASFFTRNRATYADLGGIFSMSNQSAALGHVCPYALHMVLAYAKRSGYKVTT